MTDKRSISDMIRNQMAAKELDAKRVIEATAIPDSYLSALLESQSEKLPPFPYVRNYLVRLADFLGLEKEEVLAAYRREFIEKVSGPADRLPQNRFALPSGRRRWIVVLIGILIVIAAITLGSRALSTPTFLLIIPDPNQNPYVVAESLITLRGRANPSDTLMINGETVPISEDGTFSKEYQLDPELNTFTFSIKRFLGKEVTITKQVYLQTLIEEPSPFSP